SQRLCPKWAVRASSSVAHHRGERGTVDRGQRISGSDPEGIPGPGRRRQTEHYARELVSRGSRFPTHDVSAPARPPRSMMTTVFQRVGPYEILEEIGRGGMAAVFLATDTRTARRVALKLVPTGNDREAREILEAECWGAKLQEQFCRVSGHVPIV